MVTSTRLYQNTGRFLILLYLLLFPFGQLLRFGFDINYGNLQDIIVLMSLPFYFFWPSKHPVIDNYVRRFFYVAIYSILFSLYYFSFPDVVYGSLYLLRVISYYTFGILVYNLIRLKVFSSMFLLRSLVLVSVATALFGWLQYLMSPDLVYLKYMHWDDHMNRLVGTFLDPGFTGIILSLGALVTLYLYRIKKFKILLLTFIFLALTVLFTYSRASYLTLTFGLIVFVINEKINVKLLMSSLVLVIIGIVTFLPKLPGEGTNLLRTQSIIARAVNYSQTIQIIKTNPVFGIGLNNLCKMRVKMFGEKNVSHACSGVDSSILFVLSTTGIVGLMVFLSTVVSAVHSFDRNQKRLILPIICSIFVHSLFVQSMFYSFVMGYLAIIFGSIGDLRRKSYLK